MISVLLPIRTGRGLNDRVHWAHRARKVKQERQAAFLIVPPRVPVPCVVTLTRVSAGRLDTDNLQGALKGVRDGVADRLQVDDGDERVQWRYSQERSKRGSWGVRIEIEPA